MKRPMGAEIISSSLILLFVYTASSKLLAHDSFTNTLQDLPSISWGAGVLAWLVPLSEFGIALLLLFPTTRTRGLFASLALLATFTAYLLLLIITRSNLPCSCGGVISSLTWSQHILFNFFFLALTGFGIRLQHPPCNRQTHPG